jgi:predicted nuclease of predicted toxin-antitoxin system
MKLLLDENLPVKLKFRFTENGINAFTVRDMNWLGKGNGDLLKSMLDHDFNCFITIDNNLSFQNNFINYPISVIVLIANDNTYKTIMELFTKILDCIKDNFTGAKVLIHNKYRSSN